MFNFFVFCYLFFKWLSENRIYHNIILINNNNNNSSMWRTLLYKFSVHQCLIGLSLLPLLNPLSVQILTMGFLRVLLNLCQTTECIWINTNNQDTAASTNHKIKTLYRSRHRFCGQNKCQFLKCFIKTVIVTLTVQPFPTVKHKGQNSRKPETKDLIKCYGASSAKVSVIIQLK